MAPPIRIGPLSEREAVDLTHALSVRGLVGKVVGSNRRISVVVHDAHEDPRRLLADVAAAVEDWTADRGLRRFEVRKRQGSMSIRIAPETRDTPDTPPAEVTELHSGRRLRQTQPLS